MDGSDAPGAGQRPAGKSRFDDIYDQPDPRAYFTRLAPLGYEIPHHAQAVFRRAAAERAAVPDGAPGRPAVLDLCCSYGINAALLNHDVTLADLYAHYTAPGTADLTTEELAARDREFYARRRRPDAHPVIGLDIAGRAVGYARAVGLLDAGFTDNLEAGPPGPALSTALADVGLVTLTGGGSYVTERTFGALLSRPLRHPVWVSAFVLRTVSYAAVAETLAARGLHTAADASRTYPQRAFTDPAERDFAVAAVRALGADPAGREAAGCFHTVLYESREPGPAPAVP
ncbi:hypothetical protein BJP40_08900 [Streptomyces sp. CC53]|uniref:hypothetical protein n=1 Tax=unclassified Streptomyces TaxID=2593676 RepID=UPI0008DC8CE5|nr:MULTISPECIES: hypothetical protein [unclassified Streptomyces]OII60954.1 hypothetical protein BJP40_08900 [Streptomyces sp. CC53]